MKKYLRCFLAIALLLCVAVSQSYAAADVEIVTGSGAFRIFTFINRDTDAAYQITNVGATTIIAGRDEIMGYAISPISSSSDYAVTYSSETVGTIVDQLSTTTGDADTYIIDEIEADTNGNPAEKMYPRSVSLSRGLTVRQGPQTCMTVYMLRVR